MILSEILKPLDKGVLQSCCDKGQGNFGGRRLKSGLKMGFRHL